MTTDHRAVDAAEENARLRREAAELKAGIDLRCDYTDNPCGTDTMGNGAVCLCYSCTNWRGVASLRAQLAEAVEALEWYGEQAEGCRKIGRAGNPAREALDADGGKLARTTLASLKGNDQGEAGNDG